MGYKDKYQSSDSQVRANSHSGTTGGNFLRFHVCFGFSKKGQWPAGSSDTARPSPTMLFLFASPALRGLWSPSGSWSCGPGSCWEWGHHWWGKMSWMVRVRVPFAAQSTTERSFVTDKLNQACRLSGFLAWSGEDLWEKVCWAAKKPVSF